ncbi:hypothetical protein KXJ69_10540 [Aureisphaera sp. CAU 1614]|uniref:Uncharacterized protein n=1 Tax=Halomarinibacterium sedimenti TaxID=2857106 RepID=A0A9X1FRK2_9FLAO|nr:hypothetical protein [Halomarinibacterium sedimenti]MBW2938547.1 hypothetical protein [Halomarinibacterium sedimenti]
MKNSLFLIVALLFFVGCKDNPVSKKIKEAKQNVSNTNSAIEELNDMQEDIEELKEISPLTNDELKAWLPDEINGMKRTSFKAGQTSFMKIASIEASYSNEDKSKTFKIQIIDGAGEMGAAATAGMRMLFSQDFEEETETQVKRSIKKKGVKAIEEYRKDGSNCTIQFMQDDRFYINASGRNMDLDETWKAIDDLDVQNLG